MMMPRSLMTLDVVVPTYNRSRLMRKTVESLLRARVPDNLRVRIIVVDNRSSDDTPDVIRELQETASYPVTYVCESTQGSSAARNAGIAASTADLVGFVDDDEEVHEGWYCAVAAEFADPTVEYIGGPCLLNREVPFPDWLPPGYHSVIGDIPAKVRGQYGPGHPGMLNGGNAVLRRSVFDRVGMFSERLGRSAKNLLSEEDADLFRRLQAAGIRGVYSPELIILHYVHEERLTRKYHRRWAYWRAVSQGVLDREVQEPVSYFCGVPRYKIGRALKGLLHLPRHHFAENGKAQAFADELATWDLAGFVYGKYLFREQNHYVEKG